MQQRYYDPVIGRFYSNDPVRFSADNPMMFNRYAYANNNPYKFVDPDGRAAESFFVQGKMYENTMQAVSNAWGDLKSRNDNTVQSGVRSIADVATPENAAFVVGFVPGNGPLIAGFVLTTADMLQTGSFSGPGGLAAGMAIQTALDKKFPAGKKGLNFVAGAVGGVFAGNEIKQHEKGMSDRANQSNKSQTEKVKFVRVNSRKESMEKARDIKKENK